MNKEQLKEGLNDIIDTVKYGVLIFLLFVLLMACLVLPCAMVIVKFYAYWRIAFGV